MRHGLGRSHACKSPKNQVSNPLEIAPVSTPNLFTYCNISAIILLSKLQLPAEKLISSVSLLEEKCHENRFCFGYQ
jgi:hypothetical protein